LKSIIVFGATESAKEIYTEIAKDYKIIYFCDNDSSKWGKKIDNIEIISPKEMIGCVYDYIAIVSLSSMDIIRKQLIELGVQEQVIVTKYIEHKVKSREIFLKNFAKLVNASHQKYAGCVAEAGVFQGEYAKCINKYFSNRKLFLFDTFEGFDKADVELEKQNKFSNATENHLSITSIEMVLGKMPFPENVVIRKGYFPNTAIDIDEKFVFVNLDMDLYKPTLEGLKFFWPKMVKGGIILIHDFFSTGYAGVNKAIEQFVIENPDTENRFFPIGDDVSIAIMK
jgi:putative O-methyltransferase